MTGPAGEVRVGGKVALPAKLDGVVPGVVLPATVRALPGRLQYLLQVAGRELPWPTRQAVPTGERVAVLVGRSNADGAAPPAAGKAAAPAAGGEQNVTLPARVFRLAAAGELLARLKLPDDENHHAALRTLLERGRPFTADQVRATARSAADGTTAAPARAAGPETTVADLLARGRMLDQPLTREIIAILRRGGQEPTMAQVWNVMARALQAGTTGGDELARLATAAGPGPAPATVTSLLARWQLPNDALHRNLVLLLLAGGRLPTAETVRDLAGRAQQWGAKDMPGWRALVQQHERDLPMTKSVWLRLQAAPAAADRPLAAMAAVARRAGWSAPPGEFNPSYWSKLGLGTEAELARGGVPAGDNLRGIMLSLQDVVPDAEAAGTWLEACALEAATNPDGDVVLPLLFTGMAEPLTGTLTVRDRPGGRRAAGSRPGLALALDFTALGAVQVAATPSGRGYVFTVRGTDPEAADFLAAAGASLRQAVAACGDFSVCFAGPEAEPEPVPAGVDVRA